MCPFCSRERNGFELAAGVGIAPTLPVLQTGVQTDYTIQRMGLLFGLPCASTSTSSIRSSFRIASRNKTRNRRFQPVLARTGGNRSQHAGLFIGLAPCQQAELAIGYRLLAIAPKALVVRRGNAPRSSGYRPGALLLSYRTEK